MLEIQLLAFDDELTKLSKEKSIFDTPTSRKLISGGIAGGIATAATIPLDIVATAAGAPGNKKTTVQIIKKLYREGKGKSKGIKGVVKGVGRFYKGLTPKVSKVIPLMALTFAIQRAVDKKLKGNK